MTKHPAKGVAALRLAAGLAALVAVAPARVARADDVPADRQVLILTRALAYDSSLKARAGNDIHIGVVGKSGSGASESAAETMGRAFRAVRNVKVQGLPIKASQLLFTNAAAFATLLEGQGIDVLYVCPGLEAELPQILELTRRKRIVSMGSREDQLRKGASIGVFQVDARPTIFVNLTASKGEGASFGSDLLRLAKVIR